MIPTPMIPLKLLQLSHPNLFQYRSAESTSHMASFTSPDGTRLDGLPAHSQAEAVHNLFSAETGRPLALPYANHFLPLVKEVVRMCLCFSGLRWSEVHLYPML